MFDIEQDSFSFFKTLFSQIPIDNQSSPSALILARKLKWQD
jgi:hypothetical protein